MFTAGLTGGIGSGKSLITSIFSHLGIPVFNADSEAGKILDDEVQVRYQLTEWFGPSIYVNGKPDRRKIAGIVFSNPEMLTRMNDLIHPLVMQRFIQWCSENLHKPYVVHEAAILFETGLYTRMNTTILVTAPEKIRIERVMMRDKTSEDAVRQRMQNQWTDERKSALAGFIIHNDGESPLLPQVLEIHKKLIVK